MKALLEREIKLAPPQDLDLASLGGERARVRTFDSTYFDTEGRDLLRRGVTLRRRVERRRGAWQLKLPSGEARLELEFADAEAPPDDVAGLLVALTRRAPLTPVAHLRTRRETIRVKRDGVHLADVVLDTVTVLDNGDVVGAFDELEVELVDGGERTCTGSSARCAPPARLDAGRAVEACRARWAPRRQAARAQGPTARRPAMLRRRARALERSCSHDPGTRPGRDPEDLHQFRVAIRRLRALLRARPILDRTG